MNAEEENKKEQRDLFFDVRRSVRYHTKRRQFFDRLSKLIKFLTVIGGLGTVTTLLAKAGENWTLAYGALAGIFSIIDLVIGTDDATRLHSDFAAEFIMLERQMVRAGKQIPEKELAEFNVRRLEIEAKEPPVLHVLNTICHNELITAMGYPESEKSIALGRFQKFLAPICDVSPDSLKKRCSS